MVPYEVRWGVAVKIEAIEFDDVEVGYHEFIKYFGVDNDGEWLVLLTVSTKGVWIGKKRVDDESISTIHNDIRSTLLSCPSGDPTKPVISWPTTIGMIREVVAYYRAIDWSLGDALDPFQIACFAASKLRSKPLQAKWPWGTYETVLLGHVADAVEKFWCRYDPGDVTTAPTNDHVAGWLVSDRNVSKRAAEIIATILRADGLPFGPRG